MEVAHPHWREDVKNALETLAAEPPALSRRQQDPRWPDLTNAVHWLVDDTWWDERDPGGHIGLTLRDEQEADAIRAVLGPLLALLRRLGADAPDRAYFTDQSWGAVREAAASALSLMTAEPS